MVTELIEKKLQDSKKVIAEAFDKYLPGELALAFTGGKDSTLCLYIVHQYCREKGLPMPPCFNIDEGDMFEEVVAYNKEMEGLYDFKLEYIHNSDVSKAAGGVLGNPVRVADLNDLNRAEIERLGYEEDEFPYEPESFVGNHLMKTVTLNEYLVKNSVKAFIEGIRWDEAGSRANETYFSPRAGTKYSPEHMRVCPILHFTERDVWDAFHQLDIPICELYRQGYRSLGAKITTKKLTDVPAWEQDLENTTERGGRRQDKEHLMAKLRELGYM